MTVHVRLFARAKDLARTDAVEIELDAGATVGVLRQRLASRYPVLQTLLERCAIAVNEEFSLDDLVLPAGAVVALLPPVSGGS